MKSFTLFVVLTFFAIIAIIWLADNLTTAMMTIAIITNFLIITLLLKKVVRDHMGSLLSSESAVMDATEGGPEVDHGATPEAPVDDTDDITTDRDMYGPEYNAWHRHHVSAGDCDDRTIIVPAGTMDINSRAVVVSQQRNRERQMIMGGVTKNADYYKYHFGDELIESEARDWWGRGDI